jgi:homocysteine S-methyltransferase
MPVGASFVERLRRGPVVVLDGATGTELARRGVETSSPQWSAAALVTAPEVVREIHRDYVAAGAEIVTANTFRTHARNLKVVGWGDRVEELTCRAVELVREAAAGAEHGVWVAGSQAPLADCYSPELTPDDDELEAEHRLMSLNLAAAGVDLILVETMPTLREALAATRAAVSVGLPVITSVVCDENARLLSGELLVEASAQIAGLGVAAISVNCTPGDGVLPALIAMEAGAPGLPRGAYANVGRMDRVAGWVQTANVDPEVYAAQAAEWVAAGVRVVGGCCGTTPEHVRRLAEIVG